MNEVEISFKHAQNMLNQMQAKVREQEMRQKFEVDKYKTNMDSKFKSLISSREQEWEKAWEKREEVLQSKDKKLRETENQVGALREQVTRKEYEMEALG